MKLSMWMIANRLTYFDLELHIDEHAPAILNSAHLAYATNCVHVYQEKNYIVFNGEGDIIKIFHIDLMQAFEIIQGIFDFYEDWMSALLQDIQRKDYQSALDRAWLVFKNPMILFDGNTKVLGITRQYPADSMDQEWEYLCNYGYSSLNAIQQMRYRHNNIDFAKHGIQAFSFEKHTLLKYSGYTFCLYYNDILCGRINLLLKDREINTGDLQLITRLALPLEYNLGQSVSDKNTGNINVFYSLLNAQPYKQDRLEAQLSYQGWSVQDSFFLTLIDMTRLEQQPDFSHQLNMIVHLTTKQLQSCVVLNQKPYVLILSNHDLLQDSASLKFLNVLCRNNPLRIGFSLPSEGLEHISALPVQAKAAIRYGSSSANPGHTFRFYDYAIDYLLDTPLGSQSISACMPTVVHLWKQERAFKDDLFSTLKIYLDNERSVSKTAAQMYTHRNTILYRIKKIHEILACDLDNVYHRDYCRLSIQIIKLYERIQK